MIKRFKELAWVIGLLLIAAAFVFVRATSKNRFSGTPENLVETLKNESVFVQAEGLQINDYLVVELGDNSSEAKFPTAIKVAFEGLTDKNFRKQLETSGKKILLTGNESQTAKAWVVLNQLGIKNLFILSEKVYPESFRFNFVPDTIKTVVTAK